MLGYASAGSSRILLLVSGLGKSPSVPSFPPFPSPPHFPILFLRSTEFLHCLYIFQHASLFLLNTFLASRFDSNSVNVGRLARSLRGHQRRAGRQRPNRDSISWTKSSSRKDPFHDSDIRYVAVSSLYSAILSNSHVSRLCDCR